MTKNTSAALLHPKLQARLSKLMGQLKLDHYFSLADFETWVYNLDQDDNSSFLTMPLSLIQDAEDSQVKEFLQVLIEYYHHLPQKRLQDKSPLQLKATHEPDPADQLLETFELNPDVFYSKLEQAHEALHNTRADEAIEEFNQAFRHLHESGSTFPELYRVLANKALAHFLAGDALLGETLLIKSLELNPQYVFAQQTLENFQSGQMDEVIDQALARKRHQRYLLDQEYDPDIVMTWPVQKILDIFSLCGVEINKTTFQNVAAKTLEIDYVIERIIKPSFQAPPDVSPEFEWIGAQALWYHWCPDLPSHDLVLHFWAKLSYQAEDESETDCKITLAESQAYFSQMLPQATPALGERLQSYYEYDDYVASFVSSILEPNTNVTATQIDEQLANWYRVTKDPVFLLKPVIVALQTSQDWQHALAELEKTTSLSYQSYLFLCYWALDNDQEKLVYPLAKKSLEQLKQLATQIDRLPDIKAKNLASAFEVTLSMLIDFAPKNQQKKYQQQLESLEESIATWPQLAKADQKMERIIQRMTQERIQADPAIQYLNYFNQFNINLATSEPVESETFQIKTSLSDEENEVFSEVGRNDPCPCGSGKKYKKCCYLD